MPKEPGPSLLDLQLFARFVEQATAAKAKTDELLPMTIESIAHVIGVNAPRMSSVIDRIEQRWKVPVVQRAAGGQGQKRTARVTAPGAAIAQASRFFFQQAAHAGAREDFSFDDEYLGPRRVSEAHQMILDFWDDYLHSALKLPRSRLDLSRLNRDKLRNHVLGLRSAEYDDA